MEITTLEETPEPYLHYKGKWIATEDEEVVAVGSTYEEVLEVAYHAGYDPPKTVLRIPKDGEVLTESDIFIEIFGVPLNKP